MSAAEDLILTITAKGQGKLGSSHDYPVRGRGGQGVAAMDKAMRGGPLVASFPVQIDDQIMLATSTGQSIRCRSRHLVPLAQRGWGQGVRHGRGRGGGLGRLDRRSGGRQRRGLSAAARIF
jgi:DNA gyrase/topoisomerase IV subunit A